MERLDKLSKQFGVLSKQFDDGNSKLLKNGYLVAIIAIILILYASLIAPKLPTIFYKVFDYKIVQLLMLFLIALLAQKNGTVALISAICFMITLMALNNVKLRIELMTDVEVKKNEEIIYTNDITSGSPVAEIDLPVEEIASEVESIKKKLDHEPSQEEVKAICADVIKERKMRIMGNGEGNGVMGVDIYANPQGEVYEPVQN